MSDVANHAATSPSGGAASGIRRLDDIGERMASSKQHATGLFPAMPDAESQPAEARVASTAFAWLLGRDARQRVRISRTLTAAAVYLLSIVFEGVSTRMGLADATSTGWLVIFMGLGVTVFYGAIRSGFSLRFEDPALTLPQMGFAIVCIALAYLANGESRGVLPVLTALVLLFGAFTLRAATCHRLGWAAVAVFALVMGGAAAHAPAQFDPLTQLHHFMIVATVLPTIAYLAGQLSQLRIDQQREKKALRTLTKRLTLMATHDQLTGLPNRRHIEEWMAGNAGRNQRGTRPTCIALLDLDYFKKVNDRFGHAIGDEVLRIFATAAPCVVRQGDVLARWGGEEFLLVMPEATVDEAKIVLERYRRHLRQAATWAECVSAEVTFSAGIASFVSSQTFEHALQRADTALYEAKRLGRDRACTA